MADQRLGPWRLDGNRVSRFYRGGALLDAFRAGALAEGGRGAEAATAQHDTDHPEDWVGSATRAWTPPGDPVSEEGLSRVRIGGRAVRIADMLAENPSAVGGAALVSRAGPTTGVLVKLLDAGIRLPVHAHPTRAFARQHLGSFFGKAEAWVVLATRDVPGEPPAHVRLGFNRDLGEDELRQLIEEERSDELLAAMHVRPTIPGDVWFVPPGTPHAIGAGALILEIQEPSDFSIVAETAGYPIDRADAHLGLGWDLMLAVFDRREADRGILVAGKGQTLGPPEAGITRRRLTPPSADPFFRAERWTIAGAVTPLDETAFLVAVVTGGAGTATVEGGASLELRAGMTFAVPAAGLPGLRVAGQALEMLACLPPRPADLDPGG